MNPHRKIFSSEWPQKLLILLLGLLCAWMVLEFSLRVTGFALAAMQDYRNARSLRHNRQWTIMCIGESTTATTYPQELERTLNRFYPGIKFSVINKGVPGSNSSSLLAELEPNLERYHPDMVVAMMGANDSGLDFPYVCQNRNLFQQLKSLKFLRLVVLSVRDKWLSRHPETYREQAPPAPEPLTAPFQTPAPPDYFILGVEAMQCGDYRQAAANLTRAVAETPSHAMAYIKLGESYAQLNQPETAERNFKAALRIFPKDPKVRIAYGQFLHLQRRFPEARDCFKTALALDPTNLQFYQSLFTCLKTMDDKSSLSRELDMAVNLALKAQSLNTPDLLAVIEWCEKEGKYDQAKELIFKALKLQPDSPAFNACAGSFFLNRGERTLSEHYFGLAKALFARTSPPITKANYLELYNRLKPRGILLVCMQYPLRDLAALKNYFTSTSGIIFVDNEAVFKTALSKWPYKDIFNDRCYGDFGHNTRQGDIIMAQNLANQLMRHYRLKPQP